MVRIMMILDVKEFDIVCLEFKHVCLDFKRVWERCARKCLEKCSISKHSFYSVCTVLNHDFPSVYNLAGTNCISWFSFMDFWRKI